MWSTDVAHSTKHAALEIKTQTNSKEQVSTSVGTSTVTPSATIPDIGSVEGLTDEFIDTSTIEIKVWNTVMGRSEIIAADVPGTSSAKNNSTESVEGHLPPSLEALVNSNCTAS